MGVVSGDEQSSEGETSRKGLPQLLKFQTVEWASRVMACKRPQLEPGEATQREYVNELGLWINGWVYLILRVWAGSRSFRGVEAVL